MCLPACLNSVDLPFKMKKQMMLDVAAGMQYLHGQNPVIIHRDLKSLNVLIDENWVTKVRLKGGEPEEKERGKTRARKQKEKR